MDWEIACTPFTVVEARSFGLTWEALQAKRWTRMSRGQYVDTRVARDIRSRLLAVALRMPLDYAFSGRTAAWLHGLDMAACEPIEVTVDRSVPVRARAGVRLHRAALPSSDVVKLKGFRFTSPLRTVRDLGSGRDLVEAVVAIDVSLRASLARLPDLVDYVARHPGEKGIKRLRKATALADPRSESPMETRLRTRLVIAGLPPPCVQHELRDSSGNLLGRADLCYPESRLVIEYDGDDHRHRLAADIRRQNAMIDAGYQILRFTAVDMGNFTAVVALVRHALERGFRNSR